jgi:hypothetical protein
MIGDEIMFVLPETEERNNPYQILFMGQILGALHDLAYELFGNPTLADAISWTGSYTMLTGSN